MNAPRRLTPNIPPSTLTTRLFANMKIKELRPCYTAQFFQQLVSQCRCGRSCWRIAQCNMGCLAIFLLFEALHEVRIAATHCSNWQLHCTVYHSSSNLSRNFTALLTRAHAHTSSFSFRRALQDKLLRKLHSVTGPQHQTSATCNATFSTIVRQVAEKIAQCNRAFKKNIWQ